MIALIRNAFASAYDCQNFAINKTNFNQFTKFTKFNQFTKFTFHCRVFYTYVHALNHSKLQKINKHLKQKHTKSYTKLNAIHLFIRLFQLYHLNGFQLFRACKKRESGKHLLNIINFAEAKQAN